MQKKILDYVLLKVIHESEKSIIYRALSVEQHTVAIKILKNEHPTLQEIAQLQHEFEVLQKLDFEGVVKVLENIQRGSVHALVFEDFSGMSLKNYLEVNTLDIISYHKMAISLAETLAELHNKRIIHKDIKPHNIVLNQQIFQTKLIEFGISSQLSRENPIIIPPNIIEGSLDYISPEQTGRINRLVDYRTDIYSLGVVLYEALVQQPPFQSKDPMEIIHSHIAKTPIPPHEKHPLIPKPVSDIVMKCLEKMPEDRYQSALGLKADLEECLRQLVEKNTVFDFSPGKQDRLNTFKVPSHNFGRYKESQALLSAFDRITFGRAEWVILSGPAGVGKSTLVDEIHLAFQKQHAWFVKGKYDQMSNDIPYSALIEACKDLIKQVLASNETELGIVRQNLLSTLQNNGQVMVDLIPDLELIIGKQPPVAQVEPEASQSRIKLFFRKFIQSFARQEKPLVIFLDDFHRADIASIYLIKSLMTDKWLQHLLLLTACRELTPEDQIIKLQLEVKREGAIVHQIKLGPLDVSQVVQLLKEMFYNKDEETLELAKLLLNKTGGSPLFLIQLLKNLYDEELIYFDNRQGKWEWKLAEIEKKGVSENVVELMIKKIRQLSSETQRALMLASACGSQFDLHLLANLERKSLSETLSIIWGAISEELIHPLNDHYLLVKNTKFEQDNQDALNKIPIPFRFSHDRVQLAAYSLFSEEEKASVHAEIGLYMLNKLDPEMIGDFIFTLVFHLNRGLAALAKDKYIETIKLNLAACRKAKREAAYQTAFECINVARKLLGDDCWETHYSLSYAVYLESAECAYLTKTFGDIDKFSQIILEKAKTKIEKSKLYMLKITYYTNIAETQNALDCGLECLKMFNVHLNKEPSLLRIIKELIVVRWKLRNQTITSLQFLPPMRDEENVFLLEFFINLLPPAFVSNKHLFIMITLYMMRLTLDYGNCSTSFFVYLSYANVLQILFRDYKRAYELGKLSLALCARYNHSPSVCKANYVMAAIVNHWTHPLRTSSEYMDTCVRAGLESGEFIFISYMCVFYGFLDGVWYKNIFEAEERLERHRETIYSCKNTQAINSYRMKKQLVKMLRKKEFDGFHLTDANFDEESYFKEINTDKEEEATLQAYTGYKMGVMIVFGHYHEALRLYESTYHARQASLALISEREINFYCSLSLLGIIRQSSIYERLAIWLKIQKNRVLLKYWTRCCPETNQHRLWIVDAEIARVLGQYEKALQLYDKAIKYAREQENILEEGIANELAAKCCLIVKKTMIAKAYLFEAHYCFYRWGAISKVRQLESHYPEIFSGLLEMPVGDEEGSRLSTPDHFVQSVNLAAGKNAFDLEAVLQASAVLSGEMRLEKLLSSILQIVIEYAGADRAIFLREQDGKWLVQGERRIDSEMTLHSNVPIEEEAENFSYQIVQYVIRTSQNMVLNDVQNQGFFTQDPYILRMKPKSVLCMLLSHQGKPSVILYLENHLTTDAFTPDRLRILWLLSAQIATSTVNAILYTNLEVVSENLKKLNKKLENHSHDLENKVGERTEELQQKNLQLSETLQTLKEMQKQIVQQEKLAALGALTQGVAHEIKNPLNFINNFSSLSMELLNELSEIIKTHEEKLEKGEVEELLGNLQINMQKICDHSKRADGILMSMLRHSKMTKGSKEVVNVNTLLSEYLLIMSNQSKEKYPDLSVTFSKVLDPAVKSIYVVPQDIGRAFMNILDNSLYSVREKRRIIGTEYTPEIRVSTKQESQYIWISIRDNGIGIRKEYWDKVFLPFFTTKPTGTGVGLGLSIAYDIFVKEHEGKLTFETEEGEYTEFIIELPTA